MKYADLGKRFVAYLLDAVVIFLIELAVSALFLALRAPAAAVIFCMIVPITYYTLMEGSNSHGTLGKLVMGMYVSDENGDGVTYTKAFLRNLSKILSSVFLIGYIIGCFTERKQALHDLIARTYVLEGKARAKGAGVARGGAPSLIAVNGPLAGMIYVIPEGGLTIDRDALSCQVVLPASQQNISRIHCLVTYNPMSKMFVLNDRRSTYGTYLENGAKVDPSRPTAISSGTRFYLAGKNNIFEVR
ncbi:MAG: RDD family protein [Eubacterium sp.]|nr:RDD family protein [Eubacterium sp.]